MTAIKNTPFPAVLQAFSTSFCPILFAKRAFTPIPVPIPIATISIWTGNANVSAFNACSPVPLIFATKALSTILYTACSIIEIIMGIPIFTSSLFTGMIAILFPFTTELLICFPPLRHKKRVISVVKLL